MPESLVQATYALMQRIESSKKILKEFPAYNGQEIRDAALRHCLTRSIDLAEGCILATEKCLPQTLAAATRSLYETFIRTRWVSLSDANAAKFREAGRNFLGKILKQSLAKDCCVLLPNVASASNRSEIELAVKIASDASDYMKDVVIPRAPAWDDMAKEAGLEKTHISMYGWLSIRGHGTTFGFSEDIMTTKEEMFGDIELAVSFLEAIDATSKKWLLYKQVMSVKEIEQILEPLDFES